MRNPSPVVLLSLFAFGLLTLTGCGNKNKADTKPQDPKANPAPGTSEPKAKALLVGKWSMPDPNAPNGVITYEFGQDGKFTATLIGVSGGIAHQFIGTYKVLDEKTLETEMTENGQLKKETTDLKVSKDELTLTPKIGRPLTLKRVS
jgi:uncharacterized protein (TIGR03066 family)